MIALLLSAAPLAVPSTAAQGDGVTLRASVDAYAAYNDVWGYTAPDGREYAIIGTDTGTAFYNCTNPDAPFLAGFVPGPASITRDMKTYGSHCYVVTDGGGGMQIISLANPDNPVLVTNWGGAHWAHAHNVAIDAGAGVAYVCGADTGMPVVDLSNPTSPALITTYTAAYVHDAYVQNGLAHLALIFRGKYRIVDVSALPAMPQVASVTTPGSFTHNTWVEATDTLCAVTDEIPGGDVSFLDVSQPASPQGLGRYSVPNATAHNAVLVGNLAYVAWYSAGLVVLDVSQPSAPSLFAEYDTSEADGTDYEGAWGVYPFTQNGMVYVSDRENGLFVLDAHGRTMEIRHAPLDDTRDEDGPYAVEAGIAPLQGNSVSSATIHYSVDGGSEQSVAMSRAGGQRWSGGIPGQDSRAVVDYRIVATDGQGATRSEPVHGTHRFRVGVVTRLYFNDFEGATNEGWSHGLVRTEDDWERGTPQGRAGDPPAAHSGSRSWGNDLGAAGADGRYGSFVHNYLESPPIDTTGRTGTMLRFRRWLNVDEAPLDEARILVNGNLAWVNPPSEPLEERAWKSIELDVSPWADDRAAVVVRFEMESNEDVALGGWNVDDFELFSFEEVPPTDTISLTGPSTAVAGSPAAYVMSGMPPAAPWWFLVAASDAGTVFQDHDFDLGRPLQVAGTGIADAAGDGSFTLSVPAGAAGRTVHLEVAARDAAGDWHDSNPIALTIS